MEAIFTGQVAIVSGGLGDIGRAIALEFARRGADVAVCDLCDPGQAGDFLGTLTSLGRRARYDRVDVSDAEAGRCWIETVERELGLPTLIVPNAAVVHVVPFTDSSPGQWRKELSVNLDGAYHVAHAAVRRLLANNRAGRVVFIGSWAGHVPHAHITAYCVSKAGLRMLCRCMAAELAGRDILVNEVAPGYVDAGLTGRVLSQTPAGREQAAASVPVGRLIESAEVARQVVWLCDPANRHMTGATVVMDGGLSLFGPGGKK